MLAKIIVLLISLVPTLALAQQALDTEQSSMVDSYNNRGNAWESKGDHDRAIADYNEAIRLNPKYSKAYNNRGIAWDSKGDHDQAIADYNEAIRLNPKYSKAYNNRGFTWEGKGEHDRAIADYNEAIRLDPKYAYAYNNRGIAWESKGEHDRAIADYNEAIRFDPKYAYAYNNRGIAWESKGEHDRAIADYNEAIRLSPQYGQAYSNRGIAWESKGEHDRAIADYNEAIKLNSQGEERFYPASKDECNQSCSFEHEESKECMSNVIAVNYLLEVLSKRLTDVSQIVDRAAPATCICGKAKLESAGFFSSVDIVKSTDAKTSLEVQEALLALKLPPVPKEARCLLQPPENPISFSFGSSQ